MTNTETIKDRLGIVDLARQLGLEVTGRNTAKCFNKTAHKNGDKHPSLSFDIKTNRFTCFACGVKGDIFDLYGQVRGVEFKQAVEELGNLTGVSGMPSSNALDSQKARTQPKPPPMRPEAQKGTYSSLYGAFRQFCGVMDAESLSYLTGKSRGLTKETVDRFGVFSIKDYGATKDFLLSQRSLEDLQKAGLFNEKGNLIFFQHRLLVPFTDSGEIVFLQGRRLDAGHPKYLNLKECPVPLFNVDTLQDIPQGGKVFVCEGVFDAMTLEQAGLKAVAIVGVNGFKPEMTDLFKGLDVVLALDNDESGKAGVVTLAKMFQERGQTVKVKALPDGVKDITDFFLSH